MKGQIIKLATVTVVPFEQLARNQWNCVIVASTDAVYKVGTFNISVHEDDLKNGKQLGVAAKEK